MREAGGVRGACEVCEGGNIACLSWSGLNEEAGVLAMHAEHDACTSLLFRMCVSRAPGAPR